MNRILEGATQALAYAKGDKTGSRTTHFVVCLKCEANYKVPKPTNECPVCGAKCKPN